MLATPDRRARLALVALFAAMMTASSAAAQSAPVGRGAVRGDFDPNLGLRLQSPDGAVELGVPAGALNEGATFTFTALTPPSDGPIRLSRLFQLEAVSTDGSQPIRRFTRPLRLAVRYEDSEAASAPGGADALRLFYREAGQPWVLLPTTRDSSARALRTEIDHFTEFASGVAAIDDTFDRADALTLGSTATGQQWQTDGTYWGTCQNAACPLSGAGGNYIRADAGIAAQRVIATIRPRGASGVGQAGVLLNVTPDWRTSLFYVGLDPAGRVEVWTLVGGTWSTGAIAAAETGLSGSVQRKLDARSTGSELTVLVDGTTVLGPITMPAAPIGATLTGLYAETTDDPATAPRFEAIEVGPWP